MWNARLEDSQIRIKISRRIISNLRYTTKVYRVAEDTTLMEEHEEKLKSLLRKVKEESEKIWLKIQHLKE